MRAIVLLSSLGILFLFIQSGPWLAERLAVRQDVTLLEDSLDVLIQREMADKKLPGLSVVVIKGQQVAFEGGYGFADPDLRIPASEYTVYRAGSLGHLLTTIAIMHRVERGQIHLDMPVSSYLPEFTPENPYGLPITLRHLLSHRSGLTAEPPIGHIYDKEAATLQDVVASLNRTTVVYPPETFTKPSNAAFAVAGYMIEQAQQKPFEQHMRAILDRMTMKRTSFTPRLDLVNKRAKGYVWTHDGRTFETPAFDIANTPASNVYTTAHDAGRLIQVLLAGGISTEGPILSPESLETIWTQEQNVARQDVPFGLSLVVTDWANTRRASLESTMQGHTFRLDLLPDRQLGIAVMTNLGHSGAPLRNIASYALGVMMAEQDEIEAPLPPLTSSPPEMLLAEAPGIYANSRDVALVSAMEDDLYLYRGLSRLRLQSSNGTIITSDRERAGSPVFIRNDSLIVGQDGFRRVNNINPLPHPLSYDEITGTYGHHPNVMHVIERENGIFILTDWIHDYPIRPIAQDTFLFPDYGYYNGEQIAFVRNDEGVVEEAYIANMRLPRLPRVEAGDVTYIETTRPVAEILNEAIASPPPALLGSFADSELIDFTMLDPLTSLDMQHASGNNLLRHPLFQEQRAFLQQPVAEALFRVQTEFQRRGYGIVIHEAYYPWYITKTLNESLPDSLKHYYSLPTNGSCHNRGAAVSLSLFTLGSGELILMPTSFDTLSPRSHSDYPFLEPVERANRDLLRLVMESQGFRPNPYKWWNFEHENCSTFAPMNESFDHATSAEEISIRTRRIYTVDR